MHADEANATQSRARVHNWISALGGETLILRVSGHWSG